MLLSTKLHGKTYELPETAGLKPPAQRMEALRADERVRFSGLLRTEVVVEFIETQGFSPPLLTLASRSWMDASSR